MNEKHLPDIEVNHAGYIVHQTFAHIDSKTYAHWWYTAEGKFVMHGLGEYRTEEELKKACEQMDQFILGLERIE